MWLSSLDVVMQGLSGVGQTDYQSIKIHLWVFFFIHCLEEMTFSIIFCHIFSYQEKICIYLSEIYHLKKITIKTKCSHISWKMTLFFSVAYKVIFNKLY